MSAGGDCCASAPSGASIGAATAPPSSDMNSRRFMLDAPNAKDYEG
jgi:hypothetical protein